MAKVHRYYEICRQCNGTGKLYSYSNGEPTIMVGEQTCPRCQGNKYVLVGYLDDDKVNIPEIPEA